MKKSTLKLVVFCLSFGLLPATEYIEKVAPRGTGDVFSFFAVLIIITALETDTLGVISSGVIGGVMIPQCIKTVVGVVMLLGLASIIKRPGWLSASYFNDVIILQLPITLVDVCVLVIVGTTLYWAGGMAYDTITQLGTAIGNICYHVLKRLDLLKLEDDGEERETVDTLNQGGDAVE